MDNLWKDFKNGIFTENPVFSMLLGMCPAIGVTTAIANGIGMGLATTFVLLGSNIVISLLRKIIPDEVRIPAFIVIIASFVTIVDLLMNALLPDLYSALGVYIPLIVVNCLILQRAEAKASKSSVISSVFDALGMGLGFTLALFVLSFFREVLGNGTFLGKTIIPGFVPISFLVAPTGGFIALGLILAFIYFYRDRNKGGSRA